MSLLTDKVLTLPRLDIPLSILDSTAYSEEILNGMINYSFNRLLYDKKIFTQHYHSIEEALENYELSVKVINIKAKQLEGHLNLTRTASYPFKVLGNGGSILG
jgi:hypothetical protein